MMRVGLLVAALMPLCSQAVLLAEHDFIGPGCTSGASIDGCAGGLGWGGSWDGIGGVTIQNVAADPLTITLVGGAPITATQILLVGGPDDEEVASRDLADDVPAETVFTSFLIRYDNGGGTEDYVSLFYNDGGVGNTEAGLYQNRGPGDTDFFVSSDAPTDDQIDDLDDGVEGGFDAGSNPVPGGVFFNLDYADTQLVENQTFLLVLQSQANPADPNERLARLWVNPPCDASAVDSPDAETIFNDAAPVDLDAVGFRTFLTEGSDDAELGRLRIATTFIEALGCEVVAPAPELFEAAGSCDAFDTLTLTFDSSEGRLPLDPATSQLTANYAVTNLNGGPVPNVSSAFQSGDFEVVLTFDDILEPSAFFQVTATNVTDTAGTPVDTAANVRSFGALGGNGLLATFRDGSNNFTGIATIQNQVIAPILFDFQADSGPDIEPFDESIFEDFPNGGSGADFYSVAFTGFIEVPATDTYTFESLADDGIELIVNNTVVFSSLINTNAALRDGSIGLTAGARVPIEFRFFENGGESEADLTIVQGANPVRSSTVRSASDLALLIPEDWLFTCPTDFDDSGLDSFLVQNGEFGVNCSPEQITITAQDDEGNALESFTGAITIQTDTGEGDFSIVVGEGSLGNGTANDGVATYQFVAEDNGQVIVNLSHLSPDPDVQITVTEIGAAGDAPSGQGQDIAFSSAGFQFFAGGEPDNALPPQVAGLAFQQGLFLQAVDTDDEGNCVALFEGDQAIDLAAQCVTPAAPSACAANANGEFSIDGTNVPVVDAGSSLDFTSFTLDFDDDGIAELSNTIYGEAGQFQIAVQVELEDAAGNVAETLSQDSALISVRPFGFEAIVPGNPGGTSTVGSAFLTASSAFTVNLRAVVYEGADDADGDLIPDAGANLANNDTTLNYNANDVTLSLPANADARVTPSGADPDTVSAALSAPANLVFTDGTASVNASYDEVGSIGLDVNDALYLIDGLSVSGESNIIGRFVPASFIANPDPSVVPACSAGNFNYFGQAYGDFSFDIQALNGDGDVVTLYDNNTLGFNFVADFDIEAVENNDSDETARVSGFSDQNWVSGEYSFDADVIITVTDPSQPLVAEIPLVALQAFLQLADAELGANLSANPGDPTGLDGDELPLGAPIEVLFGRLNVSNSFGPEIAPLTTTVFTEFVTGFDGDGNPIFELNSDDACTVVNNENIIIGVGGDSNVASFNGASATVSVEGTDPNNGGEGGTLDNGLLTLNISEPSPNQSGSFDLFIDLGAPGNNRRSQLLSPHPSVYFCKKPACRCTETVHLRVTAMHRLVVPRRVTLSYEK